MVATKRKIYVFLPYRSFGNSCEYIYAGVAAAQSTNKKLIIIVPSLLRFLYIKKENREFERLASEFISKDLFVSSVFQNMFFLYECVRYLANKMIFKHIGFDWYFPVVFCSKIFSIIDFSRLDRTQCVVRY